MKSSGLFSNWQSDLNDLFMYRNGSENATECKDPLINETAFNQLALIPAIMIAIIFCFTEKRVRLWPDMLGGRPGIVYPVDVLTKSDRFSYACAFGCTVNLVFACVFSGYKAIELEGPLVVKTFVVLISMLIFGAVYFPVFASLTSRSVIGLAMGSCYVWMLTIVEFIRVCDCDYISYVRVSLVLQRLPNLLCLLFLSVHMPYRFIVDFSNKDGWLSNITAKKKERYTLEELRNCSLGRHVRLLLKKPEPEEPPKFFLGKVLRLFQNIFYKPIPGFHYSARLLSTLLVAFILLYIVVLHLYFFIFAMYRLLSKTDILQDQLDEDYDFLISAKEAFHYIIGTLLGSVILANLLGVYSIFKMLIKYRETMLLLNKGKLKDFLKDRSNASILLGSMKYSGFQIVSLAWGFIIQLMVFLFVCTIIALIIYLYRNGLGFIVTDYILSLWPIPMWITILYVSQIVLCKYAFLGHVRHLVLNNRRMMFLMTYFMFFYNIFLGIFSSLLRIIKSVVCGSLILARLDSCVLPPDFANMDGGYMSYLSFMKLENDHTHPVMLAFIQLLQVLARDRKCSISHDTFESKDFSGGGQSPNRFQTSRDKSLQSAKRRAAIFKWQTLFTLINNPDLRSERKGYIQRLKRAKELGIVIPKSDTIIVIDDDIIRKAEEEIESKTSNSIVTKMATVAGNKVNLLTSKIRAVPGMIRKHDRDPKNEDFAQLSEYKDGTDVKTRDGKRSNGVNKYDGDRFSITRL